MTLNEFVADSRHRIFEELSGGRAPSEGAYDEALFRKAKDLGKPQMGPVDFEPARVVFNFIYPSPTEGSTVLTVALAAPDRIVYMPVPEWVVEQVWQGEVLGSYHFAREAQAMLDRFQALLVPEANEASFGPHHTFRRG